MELGSYEFSLSELSGATGNFGILFPLMVGYIAVCGVKPSGLLVFFGLACLVSGLVYRLPMPVEPMKVLAVVAIAQAWPPSLVYASAFGMGIVWTVFALTGVMGYIAKYTPVAVIRGIQVALGGILAIQALKMIAGWWLLGLGCVLLAITLRGVRQAPAGLLLVLLGIAVAYYHTGLEQVGGLSWQLPSLTGFRAGEVWTALLLAGFAQIPLTATNAVLSVSSLVKTYFPDRPVKERSLSLNMGLANLVLPFFGAMPMCHGAGGLAAKHYFGARSGGANIIEGGFFIFLGLFAASSITTLFYVFPQAVIGAMLLLVGLELVKFARDVPLGWETAPLVVTVITSVLTNMGYGFLAGMVLYYLLRYWFNRKTVEQQNSTR